MSKAKKGYSAGFSIKGRLPLCQQELPTTDGIPGGMNGVADRDHVSSPAHIQIRARKGDEARVGHGMKVPEEKNPQWPSEPIAGLWFWSQTPRSPERTEAAMLCMQLPRYD